MSLFLELRHPLLRVRVGDIAVMAFSPSSSSIAADAVVLVTYDTVSILKTCIHVINVIKQTT